MSKPANITTPNTERRFLLQPVEIRAADGDKPALVRGYAAKFNTRSEDLGGFTETIMPGAFDDVLGDDVRALFNHDANLILARSRNGKGTLRLFIDETGLGYEFEAPDTQTGRDLLVSIRRGDVDQSSFAFTVAKDGDRWVEEGGVITRAIKKVARLFDVSPVTYPAYTDTAVAARGLEEFRKAHQPAPPTQPQQTPMRSYWESTLGLHRK